MLIRCVVLALVAVGVAGADNAKDKDEGKAVVTFKLDGSWGTSRITYDGQTVRPKVLGSAVTYRADKEGRMARSRSRLPSARAEVLWHGL
jgi:hypothetical protein